MHGGARGAVHHLLLLQQPEDGAVLALLHVRQHARAAEVPARRRLHLRRRALVLGRDECLLPRQLPPQALLPPPHLRQLPPLPVLLRDPSALLCNLAVQPFF